MYQRTTGDGITVRIERLPAAARWTHRVTVEHPNTNLRPGKLLNGTMTDANMAARDLIAEIEPHIRLPNE